MTNSIIIAIIFFLLFLFLFLFLLKNAIYQLKGLMIDISRSLLFAGLAAKETPGDTEPIFSQVTVPIRGKTRFKGQARPHESLLGEWNASLGKIQSIFSVRHLIEGHSASAIVFTIVRRQNSSPLVRLSSDLLQRRRRATRSGA